MRKILFMLLLLLMIDFVEAREKKVKIPMQAAGLSLILPGGGQIYNQQYLKAGLIASLELAFAGRFVYHYLESEKYYQDYEKSLLQSDLDRYNDFYYKRQNDLWWLGITIFLSMIDAYVDAHLFDFEEKKKKIHLKFQDNELSLSYHF